MIYPKLDKNIEIAVSEKSDGSLTLYPNSPSKPTLIGSKILKKLKFDRQSIIEMNQVHGASVVSITQSNKAKYLGNKIPSTDGVVTNLTNTPILIKTADCIPFVAYDPIAHAIAVCHIGWRGAIQKIHQIALLKLINQFQAKTANIFIWLGPAIQACCYWQTKPPMQREIPEWQSYITAREKKWHTDYVGFVINSLLAVDIKKSHIYNSKECTCHNQDNWFSHTRSKTTNEPDGRFATLVWLKEII